MNSLSLLQIGDLPVETWQIITSYIDFCHLISLIRASNKVIRRKLLKLGGINTIQLFNLGLKENTTKRHLVTDSYVPWLTSSDIVYLPPNSCNSFPPHGFFSGITSVFCNVQSSNIFNKSFDLSSLPPTLTHLAWHDAPLIANLGSLCLHERLPRLLHCSLSSLESPNLFLEFPRCLISLRIDSIGKEYLNRLQELPTDLTYLSLGATDPVADLPVTQLRHLPPGIISLHLPSLRMTNNTHRLDLMAPHITDFTIYDVKRPARYCFPESLTKLTIMEDSESRSLYGEANIPEWPSHIKILKIHRLFCKCLPATANLTHLSIPSVTLPLSKHAAALPHSPFILGPNLVSLDLPSCAFSERELWDLPPSLKRLVLKDVKLDGTSLPIGLTHLESFEQMQIHFWNFDRDYTLLLTAPNAPTTFSSSIPYLDMEKMVTLSLPDHGRIDFRDSSSSLTTLAFVELLAYEQQVLPASLTSLHYHASSHSQTPVPIEFFLESFPNLIRLSSHAPSGNPNLRGEIRLGPKFFPTNRYTSQQASSSDSDPGSGLPILELPEDALALIRNKKGQQIEFEGITWNTLHLCDEQSSFHVHKATFTGVYSFNNDRFFNAFPIGLTVLDISHAKFFDTKDNGWTAKTPVLPISLTDLRLGGPYAFFILYPRTYDPEVKLPHSLTKLSLEFDIGPRSWKLGQPWPRDFEILEIRLVKEPPPPTAIAALSLVFNSVQEDHPKDLACRLVAQSPKPHSSTNFASFAAAFPDPERWKSKPLAAAPVAPVPSKCYVM